MNTLDLYLRAMANDSFRSSVSGKRPEVRVIISAAIMVLGKMRHEDWELQARLEHVSKNVVRGFFGKHKESPFE